MKVLIVGGGIGGLALAAFLKQKNIETEIIEKAPDWSRGGYCIGLWWNGREMLRHLGLAEKLDEAGRLVLSSALHTAEGEYIRSDHLNHFAEEYKHVNTIISRDALHAILLSACEEIPIRMNTKVSQLSERENGVSVTFSDSSTGEYDAVIGADGTFSSVRDLVFGKEFLKFSNWRAYFFYIDEQPFKEEIYEITAPGKLALVLKLNGTRSVVVCGIPADHAAFDPVEGRKDRLIALYKEFKFIPEMLEHARNEDITLTDLTSVKLPSFTKGRIALLGDAAHGLEPFGGMGASLALEDAYVLGEELGKTADTSGASAKMAISKAVTSYEKRRATRIKLARRNTKILSLLVKPKSKLFCWVRDKLIPYPSTKFFTKQYEAFFKVKL